MLLSVCAACSVSQETLQVVLGCVAWVLQFRRPLFSVLSAAYRESLHPRVGPLPPEVIDELLALVCLLAFAFSDLRAEIDPVVTVTDASPGGGGACESSGLAPEAQAIWEQRAQSAFSSITAPAARGLPVEGSPMGLPHGGSSSSSL